MEFDFSSNKKTVSSSAFKIGDLVEARMKGKLKYSPGKVKDITEKGYY